MIDTGVARHVPGALTPALLARLENRQIDIAVGEIDASASLSHLLQAKYLFVKGGSLFRIRVRIAMCLILAMLVSFFDLGIAYRKSLSHVRPLRLRLFVEPHGEACSSPGLPVVVRGDGASKAIDSISGGGEQGQILAAGVPAPEPRGCFCHNPGQQLPGMPAGWA